MTATNPEIANAIQPGGLPATLTWDGGPDGVLRLLDQTLLPGRVEYRVCDTVEQVWQAIRELCVRGAPAIGVAAAYGLCLGTRGVRTHDRSHLLQRARETADYLCACRPTAVNLAWAVRRVLSVGEAVGGDGPAVWARMLDEAHEIAREDAKRCRRIGEHGARLIKDGAGILTHCNAGALATVAYGTALAPLYVAHEQGRRFRVFADETRPLLQGARLTAFELQRAGIDVTVLCDSAAASLMRRGSVQLVIVGADRIAANGDTANKIGTYSVALAARAHHIPFYVAAPTSTFDLTLPGGDAIPIEERSRDEVARGLLGRTVADGAACYNPAFDVTPAGLVTGIITEKGVLEPVSERGIREIFD